MALLTSGVKSDEENIEPPTNESPNPEDHENYVSQNTEEPSPEPPNIESSNNGNNDNLPPTPNTETPSDEQSATTSSDTQKNDDSQPPPNTDTTTESPTELPKAENMEELSNLEESRTKATQTEPSTESPNTETSSTEPPNLISDYLNQQLNDTEKYINETMKEETTEKSIPIPTNAKNNTKPIERPNIVFIVADDLVKQLFTYYLNTIQY